MPRAKKFNLSSLDFSREENTPPWAQSLREARDKRTNAEARVDAAIGEIVQEGVGITEEQRQKAIKDFMETGDFDLATFEVPAEQPATEATPVAPERGSLESFVSDMGSLFGSARRQTVASQTLAEIKAKEEGRGIIRDIVRDVTGLNEQSLDQVSFDPQQVAEQTMRLISPNYRKLRLEQEQAEREAAKAEATRVLEEERTNIASLEDRLGKGAAGTRVARVLGGVSGQPTQALPIVGGIAGTLLGGPAGGTAGAAIGSIPLANEVYDSSYQEARDQFGATPDEATDYARAITAVEFGTEAVGGKIASAAIGRLGIKKLTKEAAQEGLARVIKSRTARVAGAAAAEAGGEAVTELTGDVTREAMEAAGTLSTPEAREKLRAFNAEQTATRLDRVLDAAIGGAGVGTAVATPAAHIAAAAEAGQQEATTLAAAQEGYRTQTRRAREQQLEDVKADTELNEDIRLEQERIAQEQAKEDAFTKAEQERVKAEEQAARQKEIEEEAAFRTIETEAKFRGQTRVERAADTMVERVPVNPPAETTPEQVQAEREQEAADEAARVERVELGGLTEQLRKRKDNLAKKGAEQQAKDDKKAKSAETRRQRVVMDQLIAENPDADPADLAPLMRSRLASGTPVAPAVEQAAPAATEAATAPVVEKATVPDKKVPDSELDALADQLGLESKDASVRGAVKEDFQPRLKRAIKGLVRKNTQQTADVQNLIRQKKLIFAPNPQALGRSETGAASYDTATGQMYIYLDRTDPDKVLPLVANALHEATHAGQFNDREGRPSILKQMMGKEKYNSVKAAILAADGKNAVATKAVAAAKAANPNEDIQDLELVPYFVSEAVKARGGFGRLGGVVRDINAAGQAFVRKYIKADLDITLDEIDAAAQQTAGEIVSTEVTQSDGRGGTLNIIAGPSSTGFTKAQQQGLTYKGFVDQGERFEIPDQTAEILDPEDVVGQNAYGALLDGEPLDLEDFLVHPELFKNYPQLKKTTIKIGDRMGGAWGSYNEPTNIIRLNRNLVVNAKDNGETNFLRNIILHETQHAVQSIEGFVPGTSNRNFMPRGLDEKKKAAQTEVERIVDKFELGAAVKGLNFEGKKAWDAFIKWAKPETLKETSALFLNNPEFANATSDRSVARQADDYRNAVLEYNSILTEWNAANTKAYNTYLRDYGETEARNTEFRSRMSDEERRATPPEQSMKDAPGKVPVERTLDTTPFVGGARALPEAAPPVLNAAPDVTNERRWVPQIVTRLFDSKQGTSSEIGEIVEFAASSPAEARMIAEASLSKYDVALKNEAKRRGTTPEQLNEQITTELEAVDKTENSYEQNKAAFSAVASKYGQAGQSLIDMRNQIDDLTMEILRQRAAQNKPLTDKEKKLYQTLRNNMGRYTHRQYAVNAGKMGDKYSKEIWKAYEKVKTGRRHNAKDLANFQRVADAVTYLVDNKLYIPDDEGLANMSADQTRSLYNVWGSVGNPEGMAVDTMKDELATIRDAVNGDKGRLEAAAESITQELLGLMPPQKALTNYFRGGKEDRAILKERQSIPPEIRKLMGEITDPSMRLMLTAAKQAEFVARNKMLLELTQQTGKDIQPPEAAGTPAVKGMQRLTGENWGPMEGYYVSDNMRALVGDVVQQIATFEQALALAAARPGSLTQRVITEGINKFGKVAGASKVMQIVGNPINFLYNYIGAYRMLLSNGNLNPKNIAKAHKVSSELIAYAISPATATKEAIRMNKYGITDSAFIGELKGAQYQQLGRLIKGMTGKTHTQAMATLRDAGVGAKELYAMMDVWSKIGNFYHQVDVLTDFYKAEGIPRTEEQINREAANKVNATNITYKRAAPLIKDLERGGITQFGTYFYEVFRSEISNFMMGLEELAVANNAETSEGRRIMAAQSAKRLSGQALAWGLTAALAKSLGEMAFGEDEEEESYLRALLPDFMQNQDFWPIGKDKDGNTVLFNVARLDPVGPITDIMRTMMQEDADLESVGKNLFDLYIAPRVGTQIIKAIAATFSDDVRPSREPAIKQLAPGLWSDIAQLSPAADRVDRAWANVLESFLPGVVTSWRDTNVHPEMNNTGDIVPAVSSYLGASMYKLDPEKSAKFAAMDYSGVLKNARKDVKEIFDDHPEGLPIKQLAARINELEAKEHEEFDKVVRVYRGMRATGMSPREAAAVFKDMRLAGDVIADVKKGEFNSRVISEDSLKQYETQELQGASRTEQKEIKAKWKMIYKMLDKAQDEK